MSKKKKPYRAFVRLGKISSLKACDTLEEARDFLASKGGGIIEKRIVIWNSTEEEFE